MYFVIMPNSQQNITHGYIGMADYSATFDDWLYKVLSLTQNLFTETPRDIFFNFCMEIDLEIEIDIGNWHLTG